jgi:hypothetical protein
MYHFRVFEPLLLIDAFERSNPVALRCVWRDWLLQARSDRYGSRLRTNACVTSAAVTCVSTRRPAPGMGWRRRSVSAGDVDNWLIRLLCLVHHQIRFLVRTPADSHAESFCRCCTVSSVPSRLKRSNAQNRMRSKRRFAASLNIRLDCGTSAALPIATTRNANDSGPGARLAVNVYGVVAQFEHG